MADLTRYTLDFAEIRMSDLARVGGKNASLGEMFNALKPKGVGVTDGFATTSAAYWKLLQQENLRGKLQSIFANLDVEDADELAACGHAARAAVLETSIPQDIRQAVLEAYDRLCQRMGSIVEVAVRSSATAEDLPEASFAGAAETYLNVRGVES
jgi:pyruvate,water dikinase